MKKIYFAYFENEDRELIIKHYTSEKKDATDEKSVSGTVDNDEKFKKTNAAGKELNETVDNTGKSEEISASDAESVGETVDVAVKSEEAGTADESESESEDSRGESKEEQLTPVVIIEPIRYVLTETHKERIVLNFYKDWAMPEDILNMEPYAVIETDILSLRNALPQINLYGFGFMATDIAKLRLLIEQRYRDFPIEKDDSQGLQSFIKDIAIELYEECTKKENGNFQKDSSLYYVPIAIFNETFEELYGTKYMKLDSDFDNRTVRREMGKHGFVKCNTVENSYSSKISGKAAKYMAFIKAKVAADNNEDSSKDEEDTDE